MPNVSNVPKRDEDRRALRILAKSVYRELRSTGYARAEIVGFTNELLGLLTAEGPQDSPMTP